MNIPVPSERKYRLGLSNTIELDIKWITWKAFFFNQDNHKQQPLQNKYIFESIQCPPSIKELSAFENDQ